VIDDVNFYVEPFLEYLDQMIRALFKLLGDVEECDTKLQILNIVGILIQQLEEKVGTF
jgi:hypothetical protein